MASRSTRLALRIILMTLFIGVVYGGAIGFHRFIAAKIQAAMASAPPPQISVSVSKARQQSWPRSLEAVGTLVAVQGVTLTAQSSGLVTRLLFDSGDSVKQGQLLLQLNDNVAQAKLAEDRAKLRNAQQELARQRKLYTSHTTSESALQAAEATHAELQAAITGDQATLANLQVRAPFDGHLGIRQVNLGQYVSPGTPIVAIQQWNPLRLQFNLPQKDLPRVSVGDPVTFSVHSGYTHADNTPLDSNQSLRGKIVALGSAVDTNTRNIVIEARVDNPGNRLRPGMFGDVSVRLNQENQVTAIPATAISYNTYGQYVYVVTTDKQGNQVAHQHLVKTGATHDQLVAITDGLKPGDTVVISGQVSLYPGAHVKIVPAPQALQTRRPAVTPSTGN